jgi:CBS domain containing-hemolysin-like protein
MWVSLLVLAGLCLLVQGFFSGSEMALVSADELALEAKAETGHAGAARALELRRSEERLLGTVLIGTNLSVITFTTLVTAALVDLGVESELVVIAISVPLALVFGEALPKTVYSHYADVLAPSLAWPIGFFRDVVFWPFLLVVRAWTWILRTLLRAPSSDAITRQELQALLSERVESALDPDEQRMIRRVLAMPESRVVDCMTPLVRIQALPHDARIRDAIEVSTRSGHTRLPVYRDRIDHIVGYLHARDLLFGPGDDASIAEIVEPLAFVPETKRIDELLREMRKERLHIVGVVDEFGGTVGIVTVEDLLEEIVGEIRDERDDLPQGMRRVGPTAWRVAGATEIDVLCEALGRDVPDGDFETVAGWLLDVLGRIPGQGELVRVDDLEIRIDEASDRAILAVHVSVAAPQPPAPE